MGGTISSNSGLQSLQPLVDGDSVETIAETTQVPEQAEQIEADMVHHPASTQPFRFLDLPKELQEMVYTIYIANLRTLGRKIMAVSICSFPVPSIAQVNHQIRNDFLQTFSKQVRFHIQIGPFDVPPTLRNPTADRHEVDQSLYRAIVAAKDPLDPIYLSPHISALIDPTMVFQNVTFFLYELYCPSGLQLPLWKEHWYVQPQEIWGHQYATLALRWCNRRGVESGTPTTGITEDAAGRDIEPVLRSLKFAEEISFREGFKGFTVEDLRRIAIKMVTGFEEVRNGDSKVKERSRR